MPGERDRKTFPGIPDRNRRAVTQSSDPPASVADRELLLRAMQNMQASVELELQALAERVQQQEIQASLVPASDSPPSKRHKVPTIAYVAGILTATTALVTALAAGFANISGVQAENEKLKTQLGSAQAEIAKLQQAEVERSGRVTALEKHQKEEYQDELEYRRKQEAKKKRSVLERSDVPVPPDPGSDER